MTERPMWDWCLPKKGKPVPVIITIDRKKAEPARDFMGITIPSKPARIFKVEGTVAALDPRKNKGPWQQPKGLFLNDAVWQGHPEIFPEVVKVETLDGKDVTKHIKMSFGPGL